jgi:hypothetical protein
MRIVDGLVEVEVTDTGAGIDAEFLPLVFDRFRQADSTTSRAHGGLGLGLSIAKQLVEAHKGTIAANSSGKGHGATFTVRMPAAAGRASDEISGEARPVAPRPDLAAPAETRIDGLRVLIVDDEADAREVMAQTLETYGPASSSPGPRASAGDPPALRVDVRWPTSRAVRMGSAHPPTFARHPCGCLDHSAAAVTAFTVRTIASAR